MDVPNTFVAGTTIRSADMNANFASLLPAPGGRTVDTLGRFLSNNTVFNVADYAPNGVLPTDGTTSIASYMSAARVDVIAAGGGIIRLPYTANGYNIGSGSAGFVLPSNVVLECPVPQLTLTYSGAGFGLDGAGASYAGVRNIYFLTTNDAASGCRWGGTASIGSFWTFEDNVTYQGSGTLTNTGVSFTLDSNAHFCAYHFGRQVYGLGYKYGLSTIGQDAGSATWTTATFDMLVLVGRAAGHIAGSRGIKTDANSNLEASYIRGLVCEGYEQSHDFAQAAGCFGFSIEGGIEGNDTNYPVPPITFAGKIEDPHGSYLFRQLCNGASNLWMQELLQSGVWLSQSHYDRLHGIDDGSSDQRLWGVRRGGSVVTGAYTEDKFIVSTGASGDVGTTNNWMKFLGKKFFFGTAIPTAGAIEEGSLLFNSHPAGGDGYTWAIQQCQSSGTIKAGLASNATTTSGSPTVTVDTISSLQIGDFITVAGAFASPTRIKYISGLTLTMASSASGNVGPIAVVYPTFTFAVLVWNIGMSGNRGDANVVLLATDAPTQRFDTALTADRTITLPAGIPGQKFRVVRHDTAAHTLTVLSPSASPIAVIPNGVPASVDVECDSSGVWILTAYGPLS